MLPTPISTLTFCLFSASPVCLTAGTKSPLFAQREAPPPILALHPALWIWVGDVLWGPDDTASAAAGGRVPVRSGGRLGSAHMVLSSGWGPNKSRDRTGQTESSCLPPTNPGFPLPRPHWGTHTPSPPPAVIRHSELPRASPKPQEPLWEVPASAGLHSPPGAGSTIRPPAPTFP